MKKIFVAIVCFVIFVNFSVCQAKRVSLANMGAGNFYSALVYNLESLGFNIKLAKLLRYPNLDEPDEDLTAWACFFGSAEADPSTKPEGDIVFWVNGNGNMDALHTNIYNKQASLKGFFISQAASKIIGMTDSEWKKLNDSMTDYDDDSVVGGIWSDSSQRHFVFGCKMNSSSSKWILAADDGR